MQRLYVARGRTRPLRRASACAQVSLAGLLAALMSAACLAACNRGASEDGAKPGAASQAVTEPATPSPSAAPPPAAAPTTQAAELGKPAPDFTLVDTADKVFKLRELRGKTVVLEWFNPDCPFIKHAHGKGPLTDMASKYETPELVWLSVNSSAPGKQGNGKQRNVDAKVEYHMTNSILLDESGSVGRAYGAAKTPHMFIIDPAGNLVYRGGLDNAPMGVPDDARPRPADAKPGELVPYVTNALADLKAARTIALADTPPYGCSVKYAD
ncbi:MAG: redoxin family protein [Myxococcales bacterium]